MITDDSTQRTHELLNRLSISSTDQIERFAALEGSVRVVLGREAGLTGNGQLGLFTVLNILARLSPVVTAVYVVVEDDFPIVVDAPLFNGKTVISAIEYFVRSLNSPVAIRVALSFDEEGEHSVSVAVGFAKSNVDISFGNDGWNVYLETEGHALVTDKFNPVGCMTAACLTAGECFKRLMLLKGSQIGIERDALKRIHPITTRSAFSCLTYRVVDGNTPNPNLPESIDIGQLIIVGVGAGGGACVYTLSTMDLVGTLTMVDSDVVNHVNLNRYLYAVQKDAANQMPKVEVLAGLIGERLSLETIIHEKPFLEFKLSGLVQGADIIVSTVDSVSARHEIQWETPRLILDAAVSESSFYVHRVELGISACLRCTHAPDDSQDDIIELIANQLDLESDSLRRLYTDNAPFTKELLEEARCKAEQVGIQLPTDDLTVKDWIAIHCGQFDLRGSADVVIPVPFATVLPGILLAGEVIKERHFTEYLLKHRINHDTFGEPSRWLQLPLFPKPDCQICGDSILMESYWRRYGTNL